MNLIEEESKTDFNTISFSGVQCSSDWLEQKIRGE